MENQKIGHAGTLESNDVMITVDLSQKEKLEINIDSIVAPQFGNQIEKVVREILEEYNILTGTVQLIDKGALDFTIKARLKTAIRRANGR